jgi:hypothetical protein
VQVPRVVALVVATGQATYAFAPASFGLLRALNRGVLFVVAALLQAAAALLLLRR